VNRGASRKHILSIERTAVEEHWEIALENLRRAIDFVKANLRITHAKILPYNACLVPLAFYFFASQSKAHDDTKRRELEEWFWRASVSTRYDQAAETKLADDIEKMGSLASGRDAMFDYVTPALSTERIAAQKLNLGSAFCKTILCALNYRGPKEFKDSTPVVLTSFSKFNSAELHHIFPKEFLRRHDNENYPERDSIANIALARASANKGYSSKAPSQYLTESKNSNLSDVLRTHFVDDLSESGLLDDDFETFLEYRAAQLLQELRKLTGEMTEVEADLSDNALRAVEKFESRLRGLIDQTLRRNNDDYWRTTGTDDLRDGVERRITQWLKENPNRKRSDVREIDFCQTFDYLKVIKSHWQSFEKVFLSRTDLEQYLKVIGNFRNALAHNREVDPATRQLALGALAWFDNAFAAGSSAAGPISSQG
jgi:hypothetical protein